MYDPWLEYQLRLAERRGLLVGRHLSRVQKYALDLVLILEAREKNLALTDAFKMAVISADPGHFIPLTYPEWGTRVDDQITEKDLDDSAGEWSFTGEAPSVAEIEATLADLLANDTITLGGPDLDEVQADDGWDEDMVFPGWNESD